jgi:hypothetical protein
MDEPHQIHIEQRTDDQAGPSLGASAASRIAGQDIS